MSKARHLTSDPRWSCDLETLASFVEPRWVVRFEGEYQHQSQFYSSALMWMAGEAARRRGCVVFEEQPAA